ncbi:MAG: Gfo/Idh/MocA family oxidoreductase [Erysipelotrichaceae bacterium]|nr:Gfo/Idh/MocA family oxidoreductase [Erysipelotrichaceae bacterium]
MINVGIVGSGFIVPTFIEATRSVKGYHYVGISSIDSEETLKMFKEKYHMDYYSQNCDMLFNDRNIDVIYVATPNGTHYDIAKSALNHGKHVILEKPFTVGSRQAKELFELAKKKKRIIFDAVTLMHLPNYFKIKELVKDIGDIKMVDINFSQYSSRYDKFKNGITLPAFDYKLAGGALMDLGIYNINFIVGLFGEPKKVNYYPNMKKKVDTSGVLVMDYGTFKATAICAKDCKAPLYACVQGDKACVRSDEASSVLNCVKLIKNNGDSKEYRLNKKKLTHAYEYEEFKRLFNEKDLKKAQEYNDMTLKTMKVLDKALRSADIKFPLK